MGSSDLKTIVYRGGVVRFRIPAGWQEEYEPAGGGMFYAPGEDTGTLRLNITTARIGADSPLYPVNVHDALKHFATEHHVEVRVLRPDVAMIRFDLRTSERGKPIVIRNWQIAHAISKEHLRIALFTYTMLAKEFDGAQAQEEMNLLDRELSVAEFAPVVGAVADDRKRRKPWWKFW
jgi:hypothetical protein